MEHLSCSPASGEELPENIIPACCLWGGNIFQHLTHKIAFEGRDCTFWPLQRRRKWPGMRRSCRSFGAKIPLGGVKDG